MRFSARSPLVVGSVVGAVVATLAIARPASAGPFGGFAADDGSYLVGRDSICQPVPVADTSDQAPRCETADQRRVAAGKYRRGVLQAGAKARYAATARGTALTITDREAKRTLVEWSALDPFGRVLAVYLSDSRRLLAVEYEARMGGRTSARVIAFALPRPHGGAQRPGETGETGEPGGAQPGQPGAKPDAPPADPALDKALAKARRLHTRGSARAALAAWRAVLARDPDNAEARYGEAAQLARQNKTADALASLEILAKSTRSDAIVWLVEARFDKRFRSLRADKRFRAAVGLDRDPASGSLYERLLGFSNIWEQPEIQCEQAEVRLAMDRRAQTFKLAIRSRCGGFDDTTRLHGKFSLHGADQVRLVLPNKPSAGKPKPDDVVACRLDACSGEQCLRCALDADLAFTLRPVRR